MNRILKRLTLSAAVVALTALPAQAQTGWGSLGIHGGWMNPAHHAEGPEEQMGFDETFVGGGSLDFWFGEARRWGLGLAGSYSGASEWDTNFGGDFGSQVHVGVYDASIQYRLISPTLNTRFLPWLSLGVGGVTMNPEDDPDSPFPPQWCQNGAQQTEEGPTCAFTPADVLLHTNSQTEITPVAALGLDYFLTPAVALRLEAKDYWMSDSPYRSLTTGETHDGGHNLVFNGGLNFYWGRQTVEEPGFVQEEPIIVTPEPEPAPPPAPVEERMTICVVEPNGFELRTIEAIRIPAENRTYVMRNGQRVAFETAYPATSPIYVRSATWYMADQPLLINLETNPAIVVTDRNRIELVTFGTPAQRNLNDLVFVGTIDGTPVYASRTDVAPFRTRLESQFTTTRDLTTILRADADLAREFGEVDTFYVAVEPNCVFQPVSVTHFVRRTRG